jgi:hypothetical protein
LLNAAPLSSYKQGKISVIGGAAVDPADNSTFLCAAEGAGLWHAAGGNSGADAGSGCGDLCIAGQFTGAIGAAAGMATADGATGLNDRAYVGGKCFIGYRIAIYCKGRTAAGAAVFTAGAEERDAKCYAA